LTWRQTPLIVAFLLFGAPGSGHLAAQVFVAPEAVRGEVERGEIVVLDVGSTDSAFAAGHLPGAQRLALRDIVVTRDGLLSELPPEGTLDSLFESRGLADGRPVLVYGEPLAAARAFVTLDVLGVTGVHILDGGLAAWRQVDGRVSTGTAAQPRRGNLTLRPARERLIEADDVQERLHQAGSPLLDARAHDEYTGEAQSAGVPRPGHIPGAHSIPWKQLVRSDSLPALRDDATLRQMLAIPNDAVEVITYCRTGVQASMVYAVARHLGYPVRLYDGSFSEWSSLGFLPVEQGE
jgi:thiosulfate/3-mercaptopyruvate sulfurtransferase